MSYSLKEIAVSKKCKDVKLTFKNAGTLAKNVMGHNVVFTKTKDMSNVVQDVITAGLDKNYVKPNDDRVIAYTNVIGGGETTTIKINPSKFKPNESYSFFCSFPGHSAVMKGVVKLI